MRWRTMSLRLIDILHVFLEYSKRFLRRDRVTGLERSLNGFEVLGDLTVVIAASGIGVTVTVTVTLGTAQQVLHPRVVLDVLLPGRERGLGAGYVAEFQCI